MARGNPGAILAMGIGTFLLALGWTGKYAQVWQALTNPPGSNIAVDPGTVGSGTEQNPTTGTTGTPPSNNGQSLKAYKITSGDVAPPGYMTVHMDTGDTWAVVMGDAAVAKWGSNCAAGWTHGTRVVDYGSNAQTDVCVRLSSAATYGGQSLEGMGITIYPNGKKAYTRLPNAGYLHA